VSDELGATAAAPRAVPFGRLWERPLQLVQTARPYSLLWFVALPMTAMALLTAGSGVDAGRLVLVVVACACGDGAFTTYNDLSDLETDRLSREDQRRLRPLASGRLPERWAQVQVVVLATLCAVLSFVVALPFGLLLLAGMVYGAVYSGLGVRVVGRPLISQAYWLVLWPSMYFGVLLSTDGTWWRGVPYVVGTMLFMGIGETLAKDLRDLENDAAAGKITTPVQQGHRRSSRVALVAFVLATPLLALAPLTADHTSWRLVGALSVVLALWLGRVVLIDRVLAVRYDHAAARVLHVGAIRVFLTINLLIIVGA
jgi:4-hydroxybenzoate polyprenyltransferase